jgi:hypothetical protein
VGLKTWVTQPYAVFKMVHNVPSPHDSSALLKSIIFESVQGGFVLFSLAKGGGDG